MKNRILALTKARIGFLALSLVGALAMSLFVAQVVSAHSEKKKGNHKETRILHERSGAFLGVKMQELSDALREGLDTKAKYGIVITEVIEGSPAEKAGLEDGDIIVEFRGKKIDSADELQSLVGDAKIGDKVKIKVVRNKKSKTVKVTLGDWEDHPTVSFLGDNFDFELPNMGDWSHMTSALRPRRLGVRVSELNGDLGSYFGVKAGKGVLVLSVEDESTAEEAGMKAGDVIVEIEGDDVGSAGDIHETLSELDSGDEVTITVMRKKKKVELKAELKEGGHYWFESGRGLAPRVRAFSVPHMEMEKGLREELDELRKEVEELKKVLKKS